MARSAGLPAHFTLKTYRDGVGELRFPLARGRISWVRRADKDGRLELLGHRLRPGATRGERVPICTLSTAREELTVQLDGRPIGAYRHPIDEKVVRPLVGREG